MPTPTKQLPPGRQALHYVGLVVVIIGALTFGSVFVSAAFTAGSFGPSSGAEQSMAICAVVGMALFIAGSVMLVVARAGLAGAGIIPDPERARKEVEPWSRMTGGVINDALSEVDVVRKLGESASREPLVKVRCRGCQALNDETAKFCSQCGQPL